MSRTLFNAINRIGGLTEQQQNAVEEQIATASMEQINFRVGAVVSLWVQDADRSQRLFPPGLALVASSTFHFPVTIHLCLFLPVFRMGMELHVSMEQPSVDTLAC